MNSSKENLFEDYLFVVNSNQNPYRIDKYLTENIDNITRNKIQKAIHNNFVLVHEKPIKINYKIQPHDVIKVFLPISPTFNELAPENIPLDIIYEDESLCIINKKAGMVVHPGHNNYSGTLANALLYHYKNLPYQNKEQTRPGIVHRLDKDTSGLLVVAKTIQSMKSLSQQFFDHSIERKYYTLVWGIPENNSGTINIHVGRHPKYRTIMTTFNDATQGKNAITHYRVIETFQYITLLECTLETGRTHQIRNHMQYVGHPIFNDSMYGGDKICKGPIFAKYKSFIKNCFKIMPQQALHAYALGFIHPITKKKMYFERPWPSNFQQIIDKWRKYIISLDMK